MLSDTVYRIDEESNMIQKVEPRREIVAGASPEGFLFGDIYRIYKCGKAVCWLVNRFCYRNSYFSGRL